MAHRAFTSHPLVVRRVTVRRIEEVTPRMRRVVVGGEGLGPAAVDGHEYPAFAAPGFDDHLKLIFASDGDVASALPVQLPHGIEWTPAENRIPRDYTPRWVDPAAQELALDFVLHGDGPAATWAQSVQPGEELAFVGPKSSVRLPEDIDWMLLVADETGLPAVGRFLDERPIDAPVHVIVLIEDESARQDLALRDGDTVAWTIASGGDAAAVEAAVRAVALPADGAGYAWAAAESRALLPVRRYLQREVGLTKDRLNITGYWHAEPAESDAAAAVEQAPEAPSPVPWLVIRGALQLGMIDALADGALTLGSLAERLGVPAAAFAPLLPVLATWEIVIADGDLLKLGASGTELLDEHHREEFDGFDAEAVLALVALAPAMRAGVSPWRHTHGRTVAEQSADGEHAEELIEQAGRLAYLMDGLMGGPWWTDVGHALLVGPGAPAVIGGLEDAGRTGIACIVHEHGRLLDALREELEHPDRVTWGAQPADLAVLALALAHRTDAEAIDLLVEVGRNTSRALLIESGKPDSLGGGADEEAAAAFAVNGAGFRNGDALAVLATSAGWRVEGTEPLGWGVEVTVLSRP